MSLIEGLDNVTTIFLVVVFCNICLTAYFICRYIDELRRRRPNSEQPLQDMIPPRPHDPTMCTICYGEPHLPVETNCAHTFCGGCLKLLWQQDGNLGAFSCPMCRTRVSLLFVMFGTNNQQGRQDDELSRTEDEIRQFVQLYNYRQNLDGAHPIWARITLLPVLLRHLYTEMMNGQLNTYLIRRMLFSLSLSLFYLVLQTDMIPEQFFGILGLFDDLLFFVFVVVYIANLYRHFVGRQDN